MKKAVVALSVALMAMTFSAGTASAFSEGIHHFRHHHHHHHHKVKVKAPTDGGSHGHKGSAAAQYMMFATFCAAGSLIVQSAYVGNTEHRELTSREAFYTAGNCFLPFIGGPLFWTLANNGNPN